MTRDMEDIMSDFADITFFYFALQCVGGVSALAESTIPYTDVTYCIDGEMKYRYNGEDIVLHSGDAVVFPAGTVRERLEGNAPTVYASINAKFDGSFVPKVHGLLRKSIRSDTVQILTSMRRAHLSLGEERGKMTSALFYYLYYQLLETARENENPHVKRIKEYIAENLEKRITLNEIAKAVHLAPQYCCALFSRCEGVGIVEFLLQQRVEQAKRLITVGDLKLAEIAQSVGFSDYNYFSRVFKRITGITATKYREAQTGTPGK